RDKYGSLRAKLEEFGDTNSELTDSEWIPKLDDQKSRTVRPYTMYLNTLTDDIREISATNTAELGELEGELGKIVGRNFNNFPKFEPVKLREVPPEYRVEMAERKPI